MPEEILDAVRSVSPVYDPLLTAKQTAERCNIHRSTVFRGVAEGTLPLPVYPTPGNPRWRQSEVEAALQASRAMPGDALKLRRAKRASSNVAEAVTGL